MFVKFKPNDEPSLTLTMLLPWPQVRLNVGVSGDIDGRAGDLLDWLSYDSEHNEALTIYWVNGR